MKLVGGAWCSTACADMSCICSHLKRDVSIRPRIERGREELLQCRLLLQPIVIVLLRKHVKVRFHVVMPQATKLGADNFVPAGLGRGEVQRNIQPGNKILLHPQLPHKKRMPNILRMHEQMNFLVHGNSHLSGHNVVFGIRIICGIEAKEILRSFIDEFRVKGAELSIRTGITEVERELSGLDLDGHGVSRRSGEIYVRPCLHAEDSEGHDFCANEQKGSNDQSLGAAGKTFNLCIRARVGELPDEKSQNELCGEKGDSSLRHGF